VIAPFSVQVSDAKGTPIHLQVGREVFDAIVAARLGDSRMPALLAATANGDLTLLGAAAQEWYSNLESGGGTLMARSLVCSTAAPPKLRRSAQQEASSSLLGEPFDNSLQNPGFCRAIGMSDMPSRQLPVRSSVPTLFISGSLDDRTPPANAEDIRRGFVHSYHLVVPNGRHELLPDAAVQAAVIDFLQRGTPPGPVILPKPGYSSIEEAKAPARRF